MLPNQQIVFYCFLLSHLFKKIKMNFESLDLFIAAKLREGLNYEEIQPLLPVAKSIATISRIAN